MWEACAVHHPTSDLERRNTALQGQWCGIHHTPNARHLFFQQMSASTTMCCFQPSPSSTPSKRIIQDASLHPPLPLEVEISTPTPAHQNACCQLHTHAVHAAPPPVGASPTPTCCHLPPHVPGRATSNVPAPGAPTTRMPSLASSALCAPNHPPHQVGSLRTCIFT